ncbi:RCC1 domain-containing protein 1 [Tupaia chinensis]|uniref:RCC1 domain-containing protein 1 n=1 Tax=Tupaia chinensis TaxID=246437 RepID=L9KJZ1_TUPCH|nr:RCC1 domain-containing protein 1 [Tupaia chinensis]
MAEELPGAWFGFGFCGFGQELGSGHGRQVHSPEPLRAGDDVCRVSASWSYTALSCRGSSAREAERKDEPSGEAKPAQLPLLPGARAYVSPSPPFYRPLAPELRARRLVLGAEHALLLGAHGQLGHGGLEAELEPRLLEALQGVPMAEVAAGGWHSVCVSATGDIYIWGWNESGQLALPARSLMEDWNMVAEEATGLSEEASTLKTVAGDEAGAPTPFIAIQPFPALVDLPLGSEAVQASCGSRHTAVVTRTGELYTWGWGKYGQLGHQDTTSSDQPCRVEYFTNKQLQVKAVTCGPWNTYVYAVEKGKS